MAKVTITLYPYAYYDKHGAFSHSGIFTWSQTSAITTEGNIILALPSEKFEVDLPDDPRPQLLEILRAHRGKLNAEHQNTLTKLQFMENNLLGLAAPEVLDAVKKPPREAPYGDLIDRDDDIPF